MFKKSIKLAIVLALVLGIVSQSTLTNHTVEADETSTQETISSSAQANNEVKYYSTSEGLLSNQLTRSNGNVERLFMVNFFDDDGHELVLNVPFYTGDGIAYPSNATTPEKEGYTFIGWQTSSGEDVDLTTLEPVFTGENDVPTINLKAKYEKNIEDNQTVNTVVVKYVGYGKPGVSSDGETVANTYQAELTTDQTLMIPSPVVSEYKLQDDANTQVTITGASQSEIIIAYDYVGEDVKYTVNHNYPNVDGTIHTVEETLYGAPGSHVYAVANEITGFKYVDGHLEGIVAKDGTTELTINYERIQVSVVFNTSQGATQYPAVDGVYEQSVDVSHAMNATKPGYTLLGYEDQYNVMYDATSLTNNFILPAETLYLTAIWQSEEVNYIVNYYVEKDGIIGENAVDYTQADGMSPFTYTANELSDAQLNDKNNFEYHSSKEGSAVVGTAVGDLDLSTFIASIPGDISNDASKAYREYANKMDSNAEIVNVDGTTIINLYYINKIYVAEFQLQNGSISEGKSYIPEMTMFPGTDEETDYTYPVNQWFPGPKYRFTFKYGQDISGLWPHPTNGTTFDLGEGFQFYGWQIIGPTHYQPSLSNFSVTTLIGNETVGRDALIPVAAIAMPEYDSHLVVNFTGVATTTASKLSYWVEALPNQDLTGLDTIEKNGITFVSRGSAISVGLSHLPMDIPGFVADDSLTETQTGVDVDGYGEANDEIKNFFYMREKYDIFLNLNNGFGLDVIDDIPYEHNIETHMNNSGNEYTPTKPGSTFVGWYTTETFEPGSEYDFNTSMGMSNIQLHAKWVDSNYNITFDFDIDGIESQTTVYANYDQLELPEEPTKVGYTFNGWLSLDTNEYATLGEAVTKDVVYTAQWRPIQDLTMKITHQYTDVDGTLYEVSETLTDQAFGTTANYYAKSSGELITAGFPSGYYKTQTQSQEYTIALENNELIFTYTTYEGLHYIVEYVDGNGTALLESKQVSTSAQVVNIGAEDIQGYTPRVTRISRDIVNESNVLTFIYDEIIVPDVNVQVNFYLKEENVNTLLDTTSFDAKLGLYIDDVTTNALVASKMTELSTANADIEFDTSSIVSKYIGDATVFNIYYTTNTISEITVVPTDVCIQYDGGNHTLATDLFDVYVDGRLVSDLEAENVSLLVTDVNPNTTRSDAFATNILDTFVGHNVEGEKNLWVKAVSGTKESMAANFTHEITPLDVEVVANDIKYPITQPEPDYSHVITQNNFITGDDIQVTIEKTCLTPTVGLYDDVLVPDVIGSDVQNYNVIEVPGDIHIFEDILVDEDEDTNGELPGDGIDDYYQTTVIYKVVNGTWNDSTNMEIHEVITFMYDGVPSENALAIAILSKIPSNMIAYTGYHNGTWDITPPSNMMYTKEVLTYTYTFVKERHTVTYPGVGTTPDGTLPEDSFEVDHGEDIIIDNNDGTPPKKQTITEDTVLDEPIRDGYIFEGYTFDPTTNTLVATWTKAATPSTGDNTPILLWCGVMASTVLGFVMLKRKRKEVK